VKGNNKTNPDRNIVQFRITENYRKLFDEIESGDRAEYIRQAVRIRHALLKDMTNDQLVNNSTRKGLIPFLKEMINKLD
jgi:hypothetical protein